MENNKWPKNIEKNLSVFINGDNKKNNGRLADERYASFDYCFNYFQEFKEKNKIKELASDKHLQESCLQLGFYLASWGMLRGSSFLLEKSVRHYSELIKELVKFDKRIWNIDVNSYDDSNIKIILDFKDVIRKTLGKKSSDTLITKIMLGVFGNVPAFDTYFNKGFGFYCCKKNQLKNISDFYKENKDIVDKYSKKILTFDFLAGKTTKRNYTKAKIIDMIGFIAGQNKYGLNKK